MEADFTVMFVVDSTGRVDDGTVEVPRDVHRLFADAVRYALSRSRYLPAQLAGRPVRQLVAAGVRVSHAALVGSVRAQRDHGIDA